MISRVTGSIAPARPPGINSPTPWSVTTSRLQPKPQLALGQDFDDEIWLDHGRCRWFDDDRRAKDAVSGAEPVAHEQRGASCLAFALEIGVAFSDVRGSVRFFSSGLNAAHGRPFHHANGRDPQVHNLGRL